MRRISCQRPAAVLISVIMAIAWVGGAYATEEGSKSGESAKSSESQQCLYMLTYDHGGLVLWGKDHFLKYLRNAAEWLDRYPGFKIGLDNEAYTYDHIAEHDPEVLEEIRGYLERYAGRFGIGTCTYGQPLSAFINEESNIRQIAYALAADRLHLGCTPPVYIMSEHAMHAQIPQIIKGLGFSGAIMRTHFMMYGYNPTFDAALGWWVGLDGSRIATIPTYEGEGAEFGRTTVDNWFLTRYPSSQAKNSPEDFRKQFKHINPLLATRADDASLRREDLVKMYEGKEGYKWVLLEEILPLFGEPKEEFETGANDFRVRMPWGYCGNEIWDTSRRAEVGVLTAERLAATEHMLGGSDHDKEIESAWKSLLVAQHHDVQICGLLADARRFLNSSIGASERVKDASLSYVASRMEGGENCQVTVFNPQCRPRREWVNADVSLEQGTLKDIEVRRGGKTVEAALLSADRYSDGSIRKARIAILADAPGLGFVSYWLASRQDKQTQGERAIDIDRENLRVTTPHAVIKLNRDGGISSLVDRHTGKELFRAGKRSCLLAGRIDGKDCESKGSWVLEGGPDGAPWAVAREKGLIGGIPYTLELTIRADSPRLDFQVQLDFDGQKIGLLSDNKKDSRSAFVHEHKLRLKLFPEVGAGAVGVRDLPFGVAETSERYVNGNYWTAVGDGKAGVAFFNRGTMGSVREADGGFSVPLAHAMYYVWGTRMLKGRFTYQLAVYPFTGDWQEQDLHGKALEYNYRLVSICTEPGDGSLGNEVRLVEAGSANVVVSAFYTKDRQTFVRMYEYAGHDGAASVKYLRGAARVTEVDLSGREGEAVYTAMRFRPWQIRTVRITERD
jgi:alpha-mannosidase